MSDPSVVERGGIRTTRRTADDPTEGDTITCSKPGANGALGPLTLTQAHELIDQLAILLNRPDLVITHRHRPLRRDQPGIPAAAPRPQPPTEYRSHDH